MKLFFAPVLLSLSLLLPPVLAPANVLAAERLAAAKYVKFFDLVTFGSEFASTKASGIVRKWPGSTVKYKMAGLADEADFYRTVIERHAEALRIYTGVTYTEIPGDAAGEDLIFVFASRNTMKDAGRLIESNERVLREVARANCYFLSYHNPKGQIVKGLIAVNSDLDRLKVEHCLLEEMAQSLGLPNDSRLISPSIFNDRENQAALTLIDKVLLRTLYDTRIKVGTSRPEALVVANNIVRSLMAKAK